MGFSRALHDLILAALFNEAALGVVGPTTVRLHDGDPGVDGTANEVSTGDWTNYAEQTVETDLATPPHWTAPTAGTGDDRFVENEGAVSFGTATIVTPVIVTHVTVWDSSGTPKFMGPGVLDTPKTINNGDPVSFLDGELNILLRPTP